MGKDETSLEAYYGYLCDRCGGQKITYKTLPQLFPKLELMNPLKIARSLGVETSRIYGYHQFMHPRPPGKADSLLQTLHCVEEGEYLTPEQIGRAMGVNGRSIRGMDLLSKLEVLDKQIVSGGGVIKQVRYFPHPAYLETAWPYLKDADKLVP
ncbi:MAG: hypothetical protein JW727_05880 [Candidatus Aenigmarchaeota archaeon]|nr:hypothetical protein [Candidatus Aenigmarchaeota archaeon]